MLLVTLHFSFKVILAVPFAIVIEVIFLKFVVDNAKFGQEKIRIGGSCGSLRGFLSV